MTDALDLLDSSVDDLADLEKFSPIPAGTHSLRIKFKNNKDDDTEPKLIVNMSMEVVETIEMANSSQEAPEPGKSSNMRFVLGNKDGSPLLSEKTGKVNTFGQGQLKEILSVLQPVFGGNTLSEIMANADGGVVTATLKVKASKNDPDQLFNEIKAIMAE